MNIVKIFCEFSNMHIKPGNAPGTETTCFPAEVHFPDVFFQSDPVYREAYEADARPFPGQSGRHLSRRCFLPDIPIFFQRSAPRRLLLLRTVSGLLFSGTPLISRSRLKSFILQTIKKSPRRGALFSS